MDDAEAKALLARENSGEAIIKRESYLEQTEQIYVRREVALAAIKRAYAAGRDSWQPRKTPWEAEGRKPTIAELEAILASPERQTIEIQADGSIRAVPLQPNP